MWQWPILTANIYMWRDYVTKQIRLLQFYSLVFTHYCIKIWMEVIFLTIARILGFLGTNSRPISNVKRIFRIISLSVETVTR
jgi:hypothetical protein